MRNPMRNPLNEPKLPYYAAPAGLRERVQQSVQRSVREAATVVASAMRMVRMRPAGLCIHASMAAIHSSKARMVRGKV